MGTAGLFQRLVSRPTQRLAASTVSIHSFSEKEFFMVSALSFVALFMVSCLLLLRLCHQRHTLPMRVNGTRSKRHIYLASSDAPTGCHSFGLFLRKSHHN